jgi:uncharacterized protein involved in exopolysaccharide biosynthesis
LEEEISLQEIITALWEGKKIIIFVTLAALVSNFMITPLYQATATVDLSLYNRNLVSVIRQNGNLDLENVFDDPDVSVTPIRITELKGLVTVTAEKIDPQLSATTANTIASTIVKAINTSEIEKLNIEIAILNNNISFFEAKIEEYLAGQEGTSDRQQKSFENDPIYISLRTEQGKLFAELFNRQFLVSDLLHNEPLLAEQAIKEAALPDHPYNMRWQLNTAVAGVLGLMLSVFIVFIKPHLYQLSQFKSTRDLG